MKKKLITLLLGLVFVFGLIGFVGCNDNTDKNNESHIVHVYGEWTQDKGKNVHVRTCECGEEEIQACLGGLATCTKKAVCTVCKSSYGQVVLQNHTSTEITYTSNEDGTHTKKYKCCGNEMGQEACSGGIATCIDKAVCSKCGVGYGELNKNNHDSIEFSYISNKNNTHIKKNACCGNEITAENCHGGTATCTNKAICENCNWIYGEINEDEHTSTEFFYVSNFDNTHTKKRVCCNKIITIEDCSGGEATCLNKAICEACTTEYGKLNTNNHEIKKLEYEWIDQNNHKVTVPCCGTVKLEQEAHYFNGIHCIFCKYTNGPSGVTFTLSEDKTYYKISDSGYLENAYLVIPSVYNGLPVKEISDFAFQQNMRLWSITIPETIVSIGNSAFATCENLKNVTFNTDSQLTLIGNLAFYDCSSLTSITIPNGVTSIGNNAFSDCSRLTSITIPESVTEIGSSVFSDCSSLTSITIPDDVTSISEHAFVNCSNLTSITIPDSVTYIGEYSFYSCSRLTSITIPNSVTSIGECAFGLCSNLINVSFDENSQLTSIGGDAFRNCSSLESIIIPDSVTYIGECAFANCSNLTIYCEAESQPSGWNSNWNISYRPVVWAYKGN